MGERVRFRPAKRPETVIDRAIRLIEAGWCRGSMYRVVDGKYRYCLRGALNEASGLYGTSLRRWRPFRSSESVAVANDARISAMNAVHDTTGGQGIITFNDLSPSKHHVLRALRQARHQLTAERKQ